jgi:hypothetical protein
MATALTIYQANNNTNNKNNKNINNDKISVTLQYNNNNNKKTKLEELPLWTLYIIASYAGANEVSKLAMTCRTWRIISNFDSLWSFFLKQDWNLSTSAFNPEPLARHLYIVFERSFRTTTTTTSGFMMGGF